MLIFRGIQKTTLIDFPKRIATTLFLPLCNFKCGFCHNPGLVFNDSEYPKIPESEVLSFLENRKNFIEGICVTGGEPTLHAGLKDFFKKIKELGLEIKLDTNGTNPELLVELISENLVDFIAMDIKTILEEYDVVVNAKVDKEKIKKSIELIINSGKEYEFRTTVAKNFFSMDKAIEIGKMLKGAKVYCLQQLNPHGEIIAKDVKYDSFSRKELIEIADKLKEFIEKVEIRE